MKRLMFLNKKEDGWIYENEKGCFLVEIPKCITEKVKEEVIVKNIESILKKQIHQDLGIKILATILQ